MKSSRMTGCAANAWFVRCLFLLISLTLLMALMPSAHAAELPEVCYPTSVQCSEDKTELKKIYDLTPEADPKGIARSDFERDGYHYTLVELLRQELPQEESREHTETVSLQSAKKDMESVLAILPQEKEFITDDGLIGTLTLRLDTVQIEPSGSGGAQYDESIHLLPSCPR